MKLWQYEWGGWINHVAAPTKSEARARIKRMHALKTSRGISVVNADDDLPF